MSGGFERKAYHDSDHRTYGAEALFAYTDGPDKQRYLVDRQLRRLTRGEITHATFAQRKDFIDKGYRQERELDQTFAGRIWMSPAQQVRTKTANLRFKAGSADGDTFTLYGAFFGNLDRQDDIIEPGAVKNCDDFCKNGCILLGHDMALLPVATPVSCVQDSQGLLVTAKWHTTWAAQEAKTVVKERIAQGLTVSCSIGYLVNQERYENRNGTTIRILESIDVYEVSLVNVPANPLARVLAA